MKTFITSINRSLEAGKAPNFLDENIITSINRWKPGKAPNFG
jgi:hypothetical protein